MHMRGKLNNCVCVVIALHPALMRKKNQFKNENMNLKQENSDLREQLRDLGERLSDHQVRMCLITP